MATIDQKLQLFGIAFAGADLGFEVDQAGTVVFALGAVTRLTGLSNDAFIGSDIRALLEEDDVPILALMLDTLKAGERAGPVRVKLRRSGRARLSRHASLSMFRLPREDRHISCVISLGAAGSVAPEVQGDGLLDAGSFDLAAARLMDEAEQQGETVRLDLVELPGFAAAASKLGPAEAEARRRRLSAALRAASYGGVGATEMAPDRFALLRAGEASEDGLNEQLSEIEPSLKLITRSLSLVAEAPAQNLRAMRYALDRFIEDGPAAAEGGFMTTVQRTLKETARFKMILAENKFFFAYQPIVEVATGKVHHFEALARFDPNASPADTIRLAEELNLISEFDRAVFRSVAATLTADLSLNIAVNLSAVTLMEPDFMTWMDALPLTPADRARMPIEITETTRLVDLKAANALLQGLRRRGHMVCLDDFGCGGASLDYLRNLDCDVVKFDGRYIKSLAENSRDAVVLRHLVALCMELKVLTVAEMVETPEVAVMVKKLGVTHGQGVHYGRPLAEPRIEEDAEALPVRRLGEVSEWR